MFYTKKTGLLSDQITIFTAVDHMGGMILHHTFKGSISATDVEN